MARKGISYDQVANAAREIKARGQEPTLSAIRVELGNEGSFTTISTHLARWRTEETERVDTKALPPEVEHEMLKAMTAVWNVANKQAAEEMAGLRQAHADQIKRMTEDADYAAKEIARLEAELIKSDTTAAEAAAHARKMEKEVADKTAAMAGMQAAYQQLLATIKSASTPTPPATPRKKAGRTTRENHAETAPAAGNTPA